jgi:hypothetical protein
VLERDRTHVELGLEVDRPLQLKHAPANLHTRRKKGRKKDR